MILQLINRDFSIFKVKSLNNEILQNEFVFISKTDTELSVICESRYVIEENISVEHGWGCFRIAEDASFEKYGMIAFLSAIIAKEKTGILAVATYDTDYIFIKKDKLDNVINALKESGCIFI
ncbi:ACT domain-containing protein [[Clostridium] fimetarium]|uniref:CASTOR ACT domain-containing protein n=1 Tax=[Clostridium] fimetarium TaxID=99656 RepID=A0A1I0M5Z9_9FIRM|nr:ACT domain-containing protein [[Clostridium] fimetarium]SEV83897.1 hypothetical protein SAMN05421659_101236 [[Clostridium] fimetarium]